MKSNYSKAFAANLKKLRKDNGFTQKQLAEKINYSEKVITKWESGLCIPPMEAIIMLADIFEIAIDDFFDYNAKPSFFLGIDGGATKTTFVLADRNGKIIKKLILSSSNPFDLGFDKATKILDEGIRQISAGIPKFKISLFAGLSGGSSGDMKARLGEFFSTYGFSSYKNGSDTQNIMAASLGDRDGAIIILGTGISASVRVGENYSRLSGYGYLFDCGGSGYDIGRDGVRAAFMAEDGSGSETLIRDLILERTQKSSVIENLSYFYEIGKSGVASFCPVVMEAFEKGDAVATEILEKNMKCVANLIAATAKKLLKSVDKAEIVLAGGLVNNVSQLFPMIEPYLLKMPEYDAIKLTFFTGEIVRGALILAGAPQIITEGEK